jgi:hypothetical protein
MIMAVSAKEKSGKANKKAKTTGGDLGFEAELFKTAARQYGAV